MLTNNGLPVTKPLALCGATPNGSDAAEIYEHATREIKRIVVELFRSFIRRFIAIAIAIANNIKIGRSGPVQPALRAVFCLAIAIALCKYARGAIIEFTKGEVASKIPPLLLGY